MKKLSNYLAVAIAVFFILWLGFNSVVNVQSFLRSEDSEADLPLLFVGIILGFVTLAISWVLGKILEWANWLVLLSVILAALHLLTEFVISISKSNTRLIAYTTAIVFPLTTIVLFWLLMRTYFATWIKVVLGITLFVYVVTYVWHVSLLYVPSGWGWKSGYVLFFLNCALIITYYVMYQYRGLIEFVSDMPDLEER